MKKRKNGFVMLFAIILSSIVLSITLGVLNIALKEINFSSSARETNVASLAADLGIECALFNDKTPSKFPIPFSAAPISSCAGQTPTPTGSGTATTASYNFKLNNLISVGKGCVNVTILQDNTTPPMITTITSKGYNVGDASCASSNPNRVEREYQALISSSGVPAPPPPPPPPSTYDLTVTKEGTGSGTVTSDVGGINCGATCTANYSDGTVVTLSASASGGSTFASWSGEGCSGTGTCIVTMSASRNVTATFNLQSSFPVIAGTNSGFRSTNTVTHPINLPASVVSGDLLIVLIEVDGNPTISGWPANWNQMFIDSCSATDKFEGRYKIAIGGETSFNLTTSANEQSAHQSFKITGYTGNPEAVAFKNTTNCPSAGSNTTPDPANLDPSTWGLAKTLWIAAVGRGSGLVATNPYPGGYPASYTDPMTTQTSTAGVGGTVDTARRNLEVSSENPGNFTVSSGQYWVAATIAIQGI